jgi:hypothetical protein
LHSRGEKDYSKRFENPQNRYIWSHTVISNIIKNPLYLGATVMCNTETIFKVGLSVKTPDEKRIKVENTHEPLVSQEVFDLANGKILSRKRQDNSGNISIFSGLIKCGTCEKAMSQRYWTKKSRHKIFICGTYAGYGTDKCTDHRIFYDDLYNAVLNDIRACAKLTFEDREGAIALVSKLKGTSNVKQEKTAQTRLKTAEKRLADLNRVFDRLYEDSIAGRITEANFGRLSAKYQAEQEETEQQIAALRNTLKEKSETESNVISWVDLMRNFVDLQELTAEVLNELICKISVHDRRTVDGELRQTVDIHYRFVGLLNETEYAAKVLQHGGHKPRTFANETKAS